MLYITDLCSMGLIVDGFFHSKLHWSCPWRGSCSLPCCGGFVWCYKETHVSSGRSQRYIVIKPMSVQHRFLWAFQHLPLQQVPMWRAVFPVTRPHVADIACWRSQTFRIKCLLQGSQYIPPLFNNCESGQKRRCCSVLKPEHSAEIYQ